MGKFCSNCGHELTEGQDVCLGCGKVVSSNIKMKNKGNHNVYITATGIIMIVLGICLIAATGEAEYGSPILVFTIPGLMGLISGIITLNSKKNHKLLFTSGILLFVGAAINFIGILDISLFAILAIVFGIFNIKFSKTN